MRFLILLVTVFTISCYGYDEPIYKVCGYPDLEGNDILIRDIVNGKIDKDYDCVVRLKAPTEDSGVSLMCSGVVIGDRTILTARHCVSGDYFMIYVNDNYIGLSRNIHKHPIVDLAIVFTDRDLKLPIAELPEEDYNYYLDKLMTTVGYGEDYVNPEDDRRKYGNSVIIGLANDHNIVVTKEYNETTCHGDSGGPLMYCNTIVGILSGSKYSDKGKCAVDNAYYVYIFKHLDWIYSKMEENE